MKKKLNVALGDEVFMSLVEIDAALGRLSLALVYLEHGDRLDMRSVPKLQRRVAATRERAMDRLEELGEALLHRRLAHVRDHDGLH